MRPAPNPLWLSLGGGADVLQVCELPPQLVERDELFGSHLLILRALAFYLGKLLEPRLCFAFRIASQGGAVYLDCHVHAGPQPVGVAQRAADLLLICSSSSSAR